MGRTAHEKENGGLDSRGMGRRRWITPLAAACAAVALAGAAGPGAAHPNTRAPRPAAFGEQWQPWWGAAAFGANALTLRSAVPSSPGETHSALVTSRRTWRDVTISFTTTTLAQLRVGSAPNVWEVGWVMFRFLDLEDYYYFILKTNGFELGKKHGSDAQIFLATGDLPRLELNRAHRIRVDVDGPRIRVSVDGVRALDFTDPHPLLEAGSIALYEEDSHVRFDSFSAR
jgi:hypothetical protein